MTKDGVTTTFKTNDFRYTLDCVVKDKEGNVKSDKTCNDETDLSIFPINGGILVGNAIDAEEVHSYTLKLWYIDNGENQSDDMGKMYQARVTIADINQMENPYASNTNSLAYHIINNSVNVTNATELMNVPLSKVAEESSSQTEGNGQSYVPQSSLMYYGSDIWGSDICFAGSDNSECNDKKYTSCTDDVIGKYISTSYGVSFGPVKTCDDQGRAILGNAEAVLSVTQDDYGVSYYYRGNVEDNYVNFAGLCWRIVRIDGNGNIKIILEDKNTTCDNATFTGKQLT